MFWSLIVFYCFPKVLVGRCASVPSPPDPGYTRPSNEIVPSLEPLNQSELSPVPCYWSRRAPVTMGGGGDWGGLGGEEKVLLAIVVIFICGCFSYFS